ncbi:transcriptional regulator, LysR family [Emticicia oligotrophica DSM 17448]|uniref:Transcriptional regulator, LysR family n=1 Tax=Emticicia oligotrophica (strain DSM 17448 / CIP 109782 / MTCC 6937 / GPTSA100-15) TaxID=929562 RepID=A0ABN4AJK5_EMTOG|nr:LysR family transcriptional regulator [Emticicia oligotrophica]AFK02186.1 transcriptional regulator, LysR family [Emticicia oligotrophica DSM 17448]
MNYTLHQLQVFLKITQTESITKAAEELCLSQPAVSIQLKNLQDQFDIPLTEVVGRKIFITDFGKEIANAAEKILNEVYAINYKTMAHKGKLAGRLKISVVSTGKYVMPYFLSDFMQKNEGVELLMDVTNRAKVIESLEKNEVDFSLVSILPENLKIENVELMQNKLFLIANAQTNFKEKSYDTNIFEEIPIIYREQGSGTRMVMERFIENNKLPVRKKMELTSNEAVKQAVIAGLGCSIMPLIGLKNELLHGDLQIVPVDGFPITSVWNLVWLKNKAFSPVASAFLSHIKENKEAIIQQKFEWFEKF